MLDGCGMESPSSCQFKRTRNATNSPKSTRGEGGGDGNDNGNGNNNEKDSSLSANARVEARALLEQTVDRLRWQDRGGTGPGTQLQVRAGMQTGSPAYAGDAGDAGDADADGDRVGGHEAETPAARRLAEVAALTSALQDKLESKARLLDRMTPRASRKGMGIRRRGRRDGDERGGGVMVANVASPPRARELDGGGVGARRGRLTGRLAGSSKENETSSGGGGGRGGGGQAARGGGARRKERKAQTRRALYEYAT